MANQQQGFPQEHQQAQPYQQRAAPMGQDPQNLTRQNGSPPVTQQASPAAAQKQKQFPPMELSVRVRPVFDKGSVLAFADMNINDQFAVKGMKVLSGEKGLSVVMPSYQDNIGKWREVCFPVTREFRAQLQETVIGAYQQSLEQIQTAAQQQIRQNQAQPQPTAQQPVQTQTMGM